MGGNANSRRDCAENTGNDEKLGPDESDGLESDHGEFLSLVRTFDPQQHPVPIKSMQC